MTDDPVVSEVRAAREQLAAENGNDLAAIIAALQVAEVEAGHHVVTLPPKRLTGGEYAVDAKAA